MEQSLDTTRTPNSDALQQSARYIEKCLVRDNNAPSLLEQIGFNPQIGTSASGLSDRDYPTLIGLPSNLSDRTQVKTSSKVPLPPEIMEQFNHMQCHCMMGLFTEIHRAWLTIDSDIYVWAYENGRDVAYYDGLNDTIIAVGLVKPKSGVFKSFIKYLLVLTTAVDIVVLGITFASDEDDIFDEIQLVSEPIFTIPTDGTIMTSIVGSSNGRMFLGSKDGCLYEIAYKAERGWFGKRCTKINHSTSKFAIFVPAFAYAVMVEEDSVAQIVIDDTRNILYMLTEKGSIEVFDMGPTGTTLSKVARLTQNSLVQQAHNTIRTVDNQNFYPIISISPVELHESARINLVAISQQGVRYYLSTTTNSQMSMASPRPTTLNLLHVRLPPGFAATTHHRPKNTHMAHYRDRNTILISTCQEKDVLWSIGSDLFPFSPVLMEAWSVVDLDGPVLAIAEVKYNTNILLQPTQQLPPLIVRQHSEPPKKYIVLTSQGVHILMKLRPVDLLKQLLTETHGQDAEAVKAYFTIQQDDQACATSLILASLEMPQNEQVADYATNAFFIFGGEPKLSTNLKPSQTMNQTYAGSTLFSPNIVSTPMGPHNPYMQQMPPQQPQALNFSMNQSVGNTSMNPYAGYPNATMMPQNMVYDINSPFVYSSKHDGLYLYVARILRPVWNLRCVEKMTLDGKKFYLTSTLSNEECAWILCHLNSLCTFLQRNTQLSIGKPSTAQSSQNLQSSMARHNFSVQDAQLDERQSLAALKTFVLHASQVLGLWRILCEHQFHVLMDSLPPVHQQHLQNTTFKDLALFGHEVCTTLINTLINSYLGDNASVDSISLKLREVCPSLYKMEDAACSKANEMLKTAKTINNLEEKEELLESALNLCKNIAPNLNLKEICFQFTTQKCYRAVTDLCVMSASKFDPENIAGHFYKNGDQNDQDSYQYYVKRMEIYKHVVDMLDTVSAKNDGTQNITNIYGQNNMASDESNNITRQIIMDALKYPDELLHIAIYEWMMSKQMHGDLITIPESTLETFLLKASQHNPNNIPVQDILWKYYESNNNHAAAAKVLYSLANAKNPSITLKDRISYLARSLMCMRSDKVGYAPSLGVFLRELEDKLDVAKVQDCVLDAIIALKVRNANAASAEALLNSKLYEITQLWEDFAEKFELWECKLAIINCAGYSDSNVIEHVWWNILQKELVRSTASGNDTMMHILTKVKSLVKLYKDNSHCVPLEYLIRELEFISAKVRADTSLVPNFFVNMDIPLHELITAYNAAMISTARENFWLTEDNQFHYSEAMSSLINNFIATHEKYTNVEKRKLIAMSQDTVAGLLSNLYCKPNTDPVIQLLRGLQARLSRM